MLLSAGYTPYGGRFAPVLAQVPDSEGIRRLHVALSDSTRRVPGVVMGLQMSAADADTLVLRLQTSLRLARDQEILRSAARRHREQLAAAVPSAPSVPTLAAPPSAPGAPGAPAAAAAPSVAELLEAGQIAADRGALWARYRWQGDKVLPSPPLSAQDFAGADYAARSADGLPLRYLMPPFTATTSIIALRCGETNCRSIDCSPMPTGCAACTTTARCGSATMRRSFATGLRACRAPRRRIPLAEAAALDFAGRECKALVLLQPSRLRDAGQL